MKHRWSEGQARQLSLADLLSPYRAFRFPTQPSTERIRTDLRIRAAWWAAVSGRGRSIPVESCCGAPVGQPHNLSCDSVSVADALAEINRGERP